MQKTTPFVSKSVISFGKEITQRNNCFPAGSKCSTASDKCFPASNNCSAASSKCSTAGNECFSAINKNPFACITHLHSCKHTLNIYAFMNEKKNNPFTLDITFLLT